MSVCIIHMDIIFRCINKDMGRLRFPLANILVCLAIVLSCFLSENYFVFNASPINNDPYFPTYLIIFAILVFLGFYYFLEHKKNGLKFDKILFPAFLAIGAILIVNIFRQSSREFTVPHDSGTATTSSITFTLNNRLVFSFEVVVWLSVLYALVFVYNRYRLNLESYRWIGKIYVVAMLVLCFIDFIYEFDVIKEIFAGTYTGNGVAFLLGNANVWGLLIYAGIITAIILSYKRFHWYYLTCMIVLFLYMIFTTSATSIYVSLFSILAYILYEILSRFKSNRSLAIRNLIIFFAVIAFVTILFIIMVFANVPIFVNFFNFVSNNIIAKDYFTITGRTAIWKEIFGLLTNNPIDFIFGLGHRTGTYILRNHFANGIKSSHNGFVEIFLRYGLFGLMVYLFVLGLTVYAFIKHIKKKNYRFAFIYGVGFLAILAHSMAESTLIFTPNIGGAYFGFLFVIPVLNILQEKDFSSLKEDVLSQQIEKKQDYKKTFKAFFFIFVLSILLAKFVNLLYPMGIYSNIVFTLVIVFVVCFVLTLFKYPPFIDYNGFLLNDFQKRIKKGNLK